MCIRRHILGGVKCSLKENLLYNGLKILNLFIFELMKSEKVCAFVVCPPPVFCEAVVLFYEHCAFSMVTNHISGRESGSE